MESVKKVSAYRKSKRNQKETSREAVLTTSMFASGSGAAMLGAAFGPVVALISGIAGATAAYFVEQRNVTH